MVLAILSFLLLFGGTAGAQQRAWHLDAAVAALAEAWDYNESRESLAGGTFGIERDIRRRVAARGEVLLLRVRQGGEDGWLRGFTIGSRARWAGRPVSPFVDIAVGLSDATVPVPVGGTTFNYLAVIGGGIDIPLRAARLCVGARWVHVSNNGREGRDRNPDIQSIGAVVGVGWKHVF